MAMKRRPASFRPTSRSTRSKKYCLKMLGSSVEPDLLETMNSVCARSTACSNGLHLRRVGRVEHVQLRETRRSLPKVVLQHFGAQARSPHAQQAATWEKPAAPGRFRDPGQTLNVGQLAVGDAEPAEPLRFVLAGPERRVARPEPPDLALRVPFGQRRLHRSGEPLGSR